MIRPDFEPPDTAKEHQLYMSDRAAWAKLVAPRWRVMLAESDGAQKKALWSAAGWELRAELRRLAEEEKAAA